MKETQMIEFKECITNTFLKTVSAFANYYGGTIYFGIDDNGNIKGLEDTKQASLDIENKINDSISPQPDYTIEIQNKEKILKLTVKSGVNKPYMYKSKVYKRNGTATIEVDTLELSRLILEGKNIKFEELPSEEQELTFKVLEKKLKENIHIDHFDMDLLKTLNLYSKVSGYNNAAAILADHNSFPGIDMVKFGDGISVIQNRVTIDRVSILKQYDKSLQMYKNYYQHEVIQGAERQKIEKIPEAAFREAIANALIHRAWDLEAQIRVSMFEDRIEVVSPGGLASGITEEEYLSGKISVLRNRTLANVFYRLGFVEIFGTGIIRIKQLYEEGRKKPEFEVSENTIKIVLPLLETNLDLSEDENLVYSILSKARLKSISDIVPNVSFGKSKTIQILKNLGEKGIVEIKGRGRGTKYVIRSNFDKH